MYGKFSIKKKLIDTNVVITLINYTQLFMVTVTETQYIWCKETVSQKGEYFAHKQSFSHYISPQRNGGSKVFLNLKTKKKTSSIIERFPINVQ